MNPTVDSLTRRRFAAMGAIGLAPLLLGGCSFGSREASYADAVQSTWHPDTTEATSGRPLFEELVRCASLAPSSHNTQCWKFAIQPQSISIFPDLSRRCPAVDPDDHHLFVSLGCAAENMVQAALTHGLQADVTFDAAESDALKVQLEPTKAISSGLYAAMFDRQCTRADYDGRPLSVDDLKSLERAGTGNGVQMLILSDKAATEKMLAYIVDANTRQIDDPAFVAELKQWIRFGDTDAVRSGDGLFTGASGNPTVPRWLGQMLFARFFTPARENDKYARQVRSSAGIAVFVSARNDKAHWVEAGRCYERFALQATALGIRNAMLNQPVEVASVRPGLARAFGLGNRRPDLVVRFGRGPEMPRSLRRPLEAVLA
ncbi:nitroreductase family protein [soil metagenome]